MVLFPNAKINIGLQVTEKRPDGFHNINTAFVPVSWTDVLEFFENKRFVRGGTNCDLKISGIPVSGNIQENLLVKSYNLLSEIVSLPSLNVRLHKNIPMGAGLGGGSADAAFFVKGLNEYFELGLSNEKLQQVLSSLGSDCSFFLENIPVFGYEKGDRFKNISLPLKGYSIAIIYPGIHSDTRLAYAGITPKQPDIDLFHFLQTAPVSGWKGFVKNDFEETVFKHFPLISEIKEMMYSKGALYASMSGSGSAVFGVFDRDISDLDFPGETLSVFKGKF